jgi:hypothetical protein
MWVQGNSYRVLVGKPEERYYFKTKSRCEDNIKMDVKEIGWETADWIHVVRDSDMGRAVVNATVNCRVP